ncbi:MAG: hypothetical protein SGJ09_15370 [Phycisphaerae bacterium]|nr:hypothetical protein [Phycisphaerae bacterium]
MNDSPDSSIDLVARIERLERELASREAVLCGRASGFQPLRRSRIGLLAAFGGGVAVTVGTLLAAAAPGPASDVVRARRVEIVNGAGKVVALLSAGATGGQFDLWNAEGVNAARIASTEKGGDLSIWNGRGTPAIGVFSGESGGRFEAYDGAGKTNARLASTADGGALDMFGRSGKSSVTARATDAGGSLAACDLLGRPVAELTATTEGGSLALSERDGTRVASLATGPRGGELRLTDSAGAIALSAGADAGGGSITTYAGDKKPTVTIGPGASGGGNLSVRNAAGKSIVEATAGDDSAGRLVTCASDGQPSVVAQGSPTGGLLGLLLGGKKILLLEANIGGGRLEIADANGVSAAAIGVDPTTKAGVLSLRTGKGQESVRIGADENGLGTLTVYNRAGTERKSFSAK